MTFQRTSSSLAAVALGLTLGQGAAFADAESDARYAGYACQKYALKEMKTLGSVRQGAPRAVPVTDPRWADQGEVWQAKGSIDAQARFGAPSARHAYVCTLRKGAGDLWVLLDMAWPRGQP